MADYFTNFSFIVQLTNAAQQDQALDLFKKTSGIQQGEEVPNDFPAALKEFADDCVFEVEAGSQANTLWLHSDCGGIDSVCEFVQHLIKQFKLLPVAFEWSYDCTKPRTDAYGGGAAYITAEEIKTISTSEWVQQQVESKHLFSPDTHLCTYCGIHADDDAVAHQPCPNSNPA